MVGPGLTRFSILFSALLIGIIAPSCTGRTAHEQEVSASGFDITPLSSEELSELNTGLTEQQKEVILEGGTEKPFTGSLLSVFDEGTYVCAQCGLPLFSSSAKFDDDSGWPAFYEPFDPDHVEEVIEERVGTSRVEIRCRRSGGHLGHLFFDGPELTGKRYCINSLSLRFVPISVTVPPDSL